jgi:hypothetical protein
MINWNLNEKSLGNWQLLQHIKSIVLHKIYKEWKNIVGLTFNGGDMTPQFTITIEQDN